MFQQIMIIGNLGRDPEMRYTNSGTAVTNMNVATSRSWTGNDGERQEKTVWFRVAAWNKLAESCNSYLTKGQRVLVIGEIEEPNVFTDQSGNARASLEVRARSVQFLSSKSEADAIKAGATQSSQQSEQNYAGAPPADDEDDDDEDIPF